MGILDLGLETLYLLGRIVFLVKMKYECYKIMVLEFFSFKFQFYYDFNCIVFFF